MLSKNSDTQKMKIIVFSTLSLLTLFFISQAVNEKIAINITLPYFRYTLRKNSNKN